MSAGDFATSRRPCEGDRQSIAALAARGFGIQAIAQMTGRAMIDVQNALRPIQAPAPAPKPVRAGSFWTHAKADLLVEVYWNQNKTADEAALVLGCTREAVIGKASRLGLKKNRPRTAQPVKLADALIAALRAPDHAAPVLRPIADELEAMRARR